MLQDNWLLKKLKKKLHEQMLRLEGVVKVTKQGCGFLEVQGKKNYFIPQKQMKKVMPGDRIIAVIHTNKKQREIAEPETLLESCLTIFVGQIFQKDKKNFIIPDYPLLKKNNIPCGIANNLLPNFKIGDWFIAKMLYHPLRDKGDFYAELTEFIVSANDYLTPWWVILARYKLERKAPEIDDVQLNDDCLVRKDLTDINFITIDGSNTEDMDDAVNIEEISPDLFQLNIAIADPTAYITEGSKLDKIAAQRAFTNYLPGFSIPMLPKKISNDLCSLRPHVFRPVLICSTIIDKDGNLKTDGTFFTAWIQSKAKLNYKNVSDWLENLGTWVPPNNKISKQIDLLYRLFIIRHNWRKNNALIFQERPDYRFILNDKCEVLDVIAEHRRIANRMIEEAMIIANICAAKFLYDHLGFGIYNVHNGFHALKVNQVASLLADHGIIIDANFLKTLPGFCVLYRKLNKQPTQYLDHLIRRFQSCTEIRTVPGPHFALGLQYYATWTSPIRKYGDMVNHRLLKAIIRGEKQVAKPANIIVSTISEKRRMNRMAKQNITDWLYAIFLNKVAGTNRKFLAEITGIFRSGIRVRLLANGAYAFIPKLLIHHMPNELTYSHEYGTIKIKNAPIYQLTDILEVTIQEVQIETRNIIAQTKL